MRNGHLVFLITSDENWNCFKYIAWMILEISETKLEEGIFDSPHI